MINTTKFWSDFLTHEELVKKYFNSITKKYYPARSCAEREDRYSMLVEDLLDHDTFNAFDSARGTFNAFLYAQVFNYLGTYYRSAACRAKHLVPGASLSSEDMDLHLSRTACDKSSDMPEDVACADARTYLEAHLDTRQIEVLRLLIDEDMSGPLIAGALKTSAMNIHRVRKSITDIAEGLPGLSFAR